MIEKIECVAITCDRCGKSFEDSSGFSIFHFESDANPEDKEWHVGEDENKGKHYCPDCHEIDPHDNLIVFPPLSQEDGGDYPRPDADGGL